MLAIFFFVRVIVVQPWVQIWVFFHGRLPCGDLRGIHPSVARLSPCLRPGKLTFPERFDRLDAMRVCVVSLVSLVQQPSFGRALGLFLCSNESQPGPGSRSFVIDMIVFFVVAY